MFYDVLMYLKEPHFPWLAKHPGGPGCFFSQESCDSSPPSTLLGHWNHCSDMSWFLQRLDPSTLMKAMPETKTEDTRVLGPWDLWIEIGQCKTACFGGCWCALWLLSGDNVPLTNLCVFSSISYEHILASLFWQFDEEFSARQEAQAESQKKEEKIKELEGKIQALESQVNPYRGIPLLCKTVLYSPRHLLDCMFSKKSTKQKVLQMLISKSSFDHCSKWEKKH